MINQAEQRFVFIDTETGGTDPHKHSLLSVGVVVWDKMDGIIAQKEFFVKNARYYVTKEAQKMAKDINDFSSKLPIEWIKISDLEKLKQMEDKQS